MQAPGGPEEELGRVTSAAVAQCVRCRIQHEVEGAHEVVRHERSGELGIDAREGPRRWTVAGLRRAG